MEFCHSSVTLFDIITSYQLPVYNKHKSNSVLRQTYGMYMGSEKTKINILSVNIG